MKSKQLPTIKGKLYSRFVLFGLVSVLCTGLLLVFLLFEVLHMQVQNDLQQSGKQIVAAYQYIDADSNLSDFAIEGLRVTLINNEGVVLFDNAADENTMSNHLQRPEIAQAIDAGEGFSRRASETVGQDTYYYAIRLKDGHILRVSMQAKNMMSLYYNSLPVILLLIGLMAALSVIMANYLTRQIADPISKMADHLEDLPEHVPYKELIPFANEVAMQQKRRKENERIRREFTANVSHELKTPLTSISGYAEMIETGIAAKEDIPDFAGKIRSEAGRLISLVGDTIKLSQLDDPAETNIFETVSLNKLAKETAEFLQLQATKLGIELSVDIPAENVTVQGIETDLFHMCYNLCDNAIRYNRTGGSVTIAVSRRGDRAVLSVKDTGIGISPEHQQRIFERFYRVDKSRSKQTGGTGLGLAIVKHAAMRHGADIELSSVPGEGTEIHIVF